MKTFARKRLFTKSPTARKVRQKSMGTRNGRPIIISVSDVEKIYDEGTPRETKALHGITFDVTYGEIVILFGQSGSGKSTTLNILAGLDEPSIGKVVVDGRNLGSMSEQEKVEYHQFKLGMVFQSYNLVDSMTVMHNITMPARLAGFRRSEYLARGRDLLKQFDLEGIGRRRPTLISGGQQQRVGIMRAMMNRPAFIIADEPTGNLDSINSELIMSVFQRMNKETNTTMVIVSHDPAVFAIADRVIHITDGLIDKHTVLTPRGKVDAKTAGVPVELRLTRTEREAFIGEHGGDKTIQREKGEKKQAELVEEELELEGPSDFDRLVKDRTGLSAAGKQIVSALMTLLTPDQQDRLEHDELVRLLDAVEKRVQGEINSQELKVLLDQPFADGGVGLYKQTAEKIASGIEVMIKLGQMEMKKRRRKE